MKKSIQTFSINALLCCCCLCLTLCTQQALAQQTCRSVSGFSGSQAGTTTIQLSWTGSATRGVRYMIRHHSNLGTSFYSTTATSIQISTSSNAQYNLFGITPHYPDGCAGTEVYWSPDIIITIDDVFSVVSDTCGSKAFDNSFIKINLNGTVYKVLGARLCCLLNTIMQGPGNAASYAGTYYDLLKQYIEDGTIFGADFCDENGDETPYGEGRTGSAATTAPGLSCYPNPVGDLLTVETPPIDQTQSAKLLIYSIDGKLMKSLMLAEGECSKQLRVNDLPTGIYLLTLDTGAHRYHIRLMKR
ncbi:MAG: T9SS type A sorting domain-containing protein [Bacteroidia bacterium]